MRQNVAKYIDIDVKESDHKKTEETTMKKHDEVAFKAMCAFLAYVAIGSITILVVYLNSIN